MCHVAEQLSQELNASIKDHSALFRELIDGKQRESDWLEQQTRQGRYRTGNYENGSGGSATALQRASLRFVSMDLPPFLTHEVKTQNPSNGE